MLCLLIYYIMSEQLIDQLFVRFLKWDNEIIGKIDASNNVHFRRLFNGKRSNNEYQNLINVRP